MAYELLLARIDEGRRAKGNLSERKACMLAGVGLKTISHIRKRGHAPKSDSLAKLAPVLGFPPEYLLDAAPKEPPRGRIRMFRLFVRGAVQAGIWREEIDWNGEDWYSLTVPHNDDRFPDVERFGLEVRGDSMDLVYPEGTILLVVRFGDIARHPEPGEKVIVLRRSLEMEGYEATLKEYQIDAQGRHILWPRSTNPEFQTPYILGSKQLPVSQNYEPLPQDVFAGDLGHAAGEPDIMVVALVVGSFRRE